MEKANGRYGPLIDPNGSDSFITSSTLFLAYTIDISPYETCVYAR